MNYDNTVRRVTLLQIALIAAVGPSPRTGQQVRRRMKAMGFRITESNFAQVVSRLESSRLVACHFEEARMKSGRARVKIFEVTLLGRRVGSVVRNLSQEIPVLVRERIVFPQSTGQTGRR